MNEEGDITSVVYTKKNISDCIYWNLKFHTEDIILTDEK